MFDYFVSFLSHPENPMIPFWTQFKNLRFPQGMWKPGLWLSPFHKQTPWQDEALGPQREASLSIS